LKIDSHNHVMPEEALELLRTNDVYGIHIEGRTVSGGNHVPFTMVEEFSDPAAKLADLERRGLEAAVVSVAPNMFYYEVEEQAGIAMSSATNEGLKRFCEHAPDRYRWMATVPMGAQAQVPAFLEQAVADGAVGVEVASSIVGQRLDLPDFADFWAAAERLKVPVLIHPYYNEPSAPLNDYYLQNVIGHMVETTVAVERLICAGVLDRHPGLRLMLVHSGGYFPYQAGRLKHARTVRPELQRSPADPWAYVGQIKFDTVTHDSQALAYLVSRVGAENVYMGTDLPFDMATPEPMRALNEAVDAATAKQIAETNPAGIFGFEA
jgi:aminocarboxymuconate-semialdehyde decarboxylase